MRHPAKRIPIKSVRLSLDDVRKIFERLLVHVNEEGDRAIAELAKPEDKSPEDFAAETADLKARAFRITVTVGGHDGGSLFGDDPDIFGSPNLPDQIAYIYMTNVVAFEGVTSQRPAKQFELNFDFSKPPLLDAQNFVSSPTPNNSSLRIEGDNDAWVSAIYESVDGILRNRKIRRTLIHKGFAYDFGMFVLALPMSFWMCTRLSWLIDQWFGDLNNVISAASYVYIFFATLMVYRILFGYTKWAFPIVELSDNRDNSLTHRLFWGAIVLGILGNFAWEAVKSAT